MMLVPVHLTCFFLVNVEGGRNLSTAIPACITTSEEICCHFPWSKPRNIRLTPTFWIPTCEDLPCCGGSSTHHEWLGVTHLPKKGHEWSENLRTWDLAKRRTGRSFGVKRSRLQLAYPLLCRLYGYSSIWNAIAYCLSCLLKKRCFRSAHFFVIPVKKSEQLRFVIEGHPVTLPGCTIFFPGYILDSRFWHPRNHEFLPPEILFFFSVKNSRCCLCEHSR